MITVPEIIDRLGGPTKVGRLCGFSVNPGARGHDMKSRRSIPVRYWPAILKEAAAKHPQITLEVLKAAHPAAAQFFQAADAAAAAPSAHQQGAAA